MNAFDDLDVTDVQRVFSFSPQCREDRGGAIYLEFVFGVVKYLDPRLVSRESYWVGDTIIQVGKWPLWSKWPGKESFLSFWNGLIEDEPWLVLCEYFFDQAIYCSHNIRWVYILYHRPLNGNINGYIFCITAL